MSRDEQLYQMALACVRGMGVDLAQKLFEVIPSEKDFFTLSNKEMREITHSRNKITDKAYRESCLLKAERELDFVEKNHIKVAYYTHPDYPQRLLHAADAPVLLYNLGNINWNAKHVVSFVGTRRCTEYGRRMTTKLIEELKEAIPDVVTVSGLALGIDIQAHRASMRQNIPTIAVQACGLNHIYPAEHRNDAAEIVRRGGSIVSDYTSQDEIHRGNFVARNRIIAGISDCTIVIESAEKGGSLITANIAQSYNRDVFAVPGRSSDTFSQGCNKLIQRNQAMLITSADDLVSALRWENAKKNTPAHQAELFPVLTPEEQKVADVIRQHGDTHLSIITETLHLPVYRAMGILMQLDMKGAIITLPGCCYSIA